MKSKQTTRTLCEGAIMVAMAIVLSFIEIDVLPQGGSVGLVFIPLMVFALRRGTVWGLGAGLAFGILKAIIGGGVAYGWASILLDYAVAYSLIGLAGLMPKKPVLSTVFGALGSMVALVLSGVIIWGDYMPDVFFGLKMTNIWFYSLLYNGSYTVCNEILAAVVVFFLSRKTKLLKPKN